MVIAIVVVIFSLLLAFNLPVIYQVARLAAEESCAESPNEPVKGSVKPLLAVLLHSSGVIPTWIITHNPALTLFVMVLGCSAYIDYVTRWVPDVLIFALTWIALIALLLGKREVSPELISAAVMLIPALLLNAIAWLLSRTIAFASGDLYVLPSIGIWLAPEWAAICMGISLSLTLIASRFVRDVPFITALYPVFVVVAICGV